MRKKRIVVLGAGGCARDVAWLIEEIDRAGDPCEVVGFVVSDLARLGKHDSHDRVLGDYGWLDAHAGEVDALALGIGTPGPRLKVSAELEARFPSLAWPAIVHPSVIFDRQSTSLGRGVILCAGTAGTVNLVLEPFVFVGANCTLGHESRLGEGSVVNPSVNISGGVVLGRGAFVGTGAQILQYLEVGERATIGAGAVVTRNVPPGEMVLGVPARIVPKR